MTDSQRPAVVSVLYIDDDPALGRLVQRTLTRQGYEVTLAGNGATPGLSQI